MIKTYPKYGDTATHRRAYYSFLPGMISGAVIGFITGVGLTFAIYDGWLPIAATGQFYASGKYIAMGAGGGTALALGGLLGALITWKKA